MLQEFLGLTDNDVRILLGGKTPNETNFRKFMESCNLTWHEMNDGRTIQLVSTDINSLFGHLGGISEIR